MIKENKDLPKLGFLYLDYVLRFFDHSNFKGWPNKIETVTYHWGKDKERFIKEVKAKKIEVLMGNIPATAYETFRQIAKELPNVRFVPSLETQFPNKSKENVTLFCKKHDISIPKTEIFYDKQEGYDYLKNEATYPQIIKKSYGPSNYGGYYVHKADNYEEAHALLEKQKYNPIYTQNGIDLKYSGDLRVMLIGHKPVCAFWRFSGDGEWITNTSQGGTMSYENVPMSSLELAVKASKAAKAEYWACDIAIDAKTDKPYILECATAFAAFPYIRDWICQYLMWDFSQGRFPKPHVPLYSWVELGKIDPSLLRTMRHIGFSQYKPSCDGAYFINEKDTSFSMDKAELSDPSDYPEEVCLEDLPKIVQEEDLETKDIHDDINTHKINFNTATLTDIMTLQSMEEDLALEICEFVKDTTITDSSDLLELESINDQMLKSWDDSLDDMRVNLNEINYELLISVKGVGSKLATQILEYKENNGNFEEIGQLKNVDGVGLKKFDELSLRFNV